MSGTPKNKLTKEELEFLSALEAEVKIQKNKLHEAQDRVKAYKAKLSAYFNHPEDYIEERSWLWQTKEKYF